MAVTKTDTLRDLYTRLAAATGPDRELDALLWEFLDHDERRVPLAILSAAVAALIAQAERTEE